MNYAKLLLEWFDENKRDLPWRRISDPYAIWVSEIMLQQTQVITVIPYFNRFMERFPTVSDLADATLEEVHTYWQGLGYYRRGENLWKGAKLIKERWNGEFPSDPKLVKEIPGIGPYTLGSVCSIAFHIPLPAVDGNVMRILSRQFMISDDIGVAKNRKIFEEKVMELMPDDPNQFNQALMELGATVCTPKNPNCKVCPVRELCMAHQKGCELAFPVKEKKVKVTKEHYKALVIQKGNKYVLVKRPEEGLLANLWGVPLLSYEQWEALGLEDLRHENLEDVTHIFTHKRWIMTPVVMPWSQKLEVTLKEVINLQDEEGIGFFTMNEQKDLPIATAFKKILKQISN